MDIYVQKDGQRVGPLPEAKIRQGIDAGEFALADLAWTTGKASWQPLSAIINLNTTVPPPIHSSEPAKATVNQSIADGVEVAVMPEPPPGVGAVPDLSATNAASERVLFEDPEQIARWTYDFGARGEAPVRTVVTDRRLKLKQNSYALNAVTSVKLKFSLERTDDFKWKQSRLYRRFAWAGVLFCLLMLYVDGYLPFAAGCVYTIGFAYVAIRYKSGDQITKRVVSTLILSGSGKEVPVIIDACMQYPSDAQVFQMVRAGYDANQAPGWREEFTESHERSVAIAEAVGLAIGQKPVVDA